VIAFFSPSASPSYSESPGLPDSGKLVVLGSARARLERDNLVAAFEYASSLPAGRFERSLRVTLAIALALHYAIPADEADRNLVSVLLDAELVDPKARAMALLARQTSLSALGRYDEALAVAHEVIDAPDVDPGLCCFACVYAGIQLRAEGDIDRALSYHQRAQRMLEGQPPTRLSGMNIACMGRLQCDRSNLEAARELNGLATKICDAIGDVWLSALGIANLAQLEQEMQSFARANELFEQALARFAAAHEAQYEGIYACRRGGLYLEWNRLDLARQCLGASQRLLARVNLPVQNLILHATWALLEAQAGRIDTARSELGVARHFAELGAAGVLGMVLELASAAVELHEASLHPATLEHWRARYTSLEEGDDPEARAVRTNIDTRFALRMLARALSRHGGTAVSHVLRIGRDASWFSLDEAVRVDVARRGSLRRMLDALIEARLHRPDQSLDGAALTRAGWPNERILAEAAATRVRVAIATLRKLGLREVLLTRDDGYHLDPSVRIDRSA
jgi:tetratricopeptide (TPR) repeat protein